MTPTLIWAGTISVVIGFAFALVARAVIRRRVGRAHAAAHWGHVAWWAGLGAYLVLQGALTILAGADRLTEGLYVASRALAIPLLCASVWGISSYLLYLYTGSERTSKWLAFVYAGVALLFYYVTFAGGAPELVVGQWIVGLDDTDPLYRVVYVFVGVPPILASAAYLALLRRVREPMQRYRILLVGGSILAYIGSGLAARLSANDAIIFVTLVLFGGAAAVASVAAHYPPRRVVAWLQRGAAW